MRRRSAAIDIGIATILIALNLLVIAPFLATDFSPEIWNNDYTYIGMTRMFRDRPWSWNPLQYGGAPFQYLYPPIFHWLALSLPVRSLGRAYHMLGGMGYAMLPAAFYLAALQLFRWRWLAVSLALVQSFSPTLLYSVLPVFKGLASEYHGAPWNFVALIASNEAAHTLALVLILLMLTAAWREHWILASVCAGAVLLTNWAGAVGLVMVLSALLVALSRRLGWASAVLRVGGVAGTAYGLAAFWITPDYIYTTKLLDRVMLRHLQPAAPWNETTWTVLAGAVLLLSISLWRRINEAVAFVLALLAISGAVVISYSAAGNYLLPLPHRYVQEFNIGLVLCVGCFAWAANKWHPGLAVVVLAASALSCIPFLRGAWSVQPRSFDPRQSAAFQISDWLRRNAGASRVLVAGELEGALNIWADVPQVSGSAQGVWNYLVPAAHRQITLGCESGPEAARIPELWLRALGVGYLVVHDPSSAEHFHWFVRPQRFTIFPAAWTNGRGDTIYRLPFADDPQAVVVDLKQMAQLGPLRSTADGGFLNAYVTWAQGKRRADISWLSPARAEIRANVSGDEGVLVKLNQHPGWTTSSGSVSRDPIGFLLVTGAAGVRNFSLQFRSPWIFWMGRGITLATLILLLARAPGWLIATTALLPALVTYGWLQWHTPPALAVAEQAYQRVQPPLINPGGIVDGVTLAQPPLVRGRIISIFGAGFGSGRDRVTAWIGGQRGEIQYRGANQLNVRVPEDADRLIDVSVEVNGCQGNSFLVETRPPG